MKFKNLLRKTSALFFALILSLSLTIGISAETSAGIPDGQVSVSENAETDAAQAAASSDDGVSPKTIIIIAVGALVIAAIAVVLLKLKSDGNPPPVMPQSYEMPPQDFQPEEPSATMPVFYDDADVGKTMPAEANKPIKVQGIRGTRGEYNLKTIAIKDNCKIGRDPNKANIVFKGTSAGVSGFHCELQRVGEGIQIFDRASSYGTFVNNVKLTVGVPVDLKPGDTIAIGSDKNTFTVY
jgi:hypothetical protein